jgi:hypothetical protein
MFTAAGFVVAKKWNNPNVHQQMNGWTQGGLSVWWNTIWP